MEDNTSRKLNDDAPAVKKEEAAVSPLPPESKGINNDDKNNEVMKEEPSTTETAATAEAPTAKSEENVDANNEKPPKEEEEAQLTTGNNNNNNNKTTSRKDWDYTNRKIMVKNVLKFIDKKKLKKMIDSWVADFNNINNNNTTAADGGGDGGGEKEEEGKRSELRVDKFKKPPRDSWVILTIDKEENVQPFIDHINNNDTYTNKRGEKLNAIKIVDEEEKKEYNSRNNNNGNNNRKRRKNNNDDDDNDNNETTTTLLTKRQKSQRDIATFIPRVVTEEDLKDKMIPLWRNTYKQQVETKEREMIKRCAVRIVKEVKNKFRELEKEAKRNPTNRKSVKLYDWVNKQRAIEIAPILHAKDIVRNKCEFTFGPKYISVEEEEGKKKKGEGGNNNTNMSESNTKDDTSSTDAAASGAAATTTVKMDDTTRTTTTTKPESNNGGDTPMEDATTTTTTTTTTTELPPTAASSEEKIKMIPSVGSMARGWSGGVSHPKCCKNIPSEAIALVEIVEQFLQDCPMPPYDAKIHTGFWRTMTIRSSRRTKQCMIIFVHAPITGGAGSKNNTEVDNYPPEVFEKEKSRLIGMLTGKDLPIVPVKLEEEEEDAKEAEDDDDNVELDDPAKNNKSPPTPTTTTTTKPESFLRVTSIFFQEFDGISMPPPEHPVQHAYGAKSITEKLGKCTFQISPGAFFQVNTLTAETLYNVVVEKVREVGSKPEETLCFDVCCGTGTIGLTLMKEGVVGKIVGVDISAPAIDDAKVNAKLNGYDGDDDDDNDKKTRFVAARAENVMGEELRRVKDTDGKIVAVVDPAREGLHRNVLQSLRAYSQIDRVVYVSCNPTGSLIQDAVILCCPPSKRFRGNPFRPTFAQPVDMFPYSNHCELVMVFDRMTDKELGVVEENNGAESPHVVDDVGRGDVTSKIKVGP